MNNLSQLALAVRFLSIDAVEQAKSGHPGMPLGMADIATVLWKKFLKYNPKNPYWFNRDRFILSNGHGSMLHYALLHLTGYQLSIDEIKNFRQLHSKTPGHPECTETPGVETTTGPLGQGIANGVGMAIAEKILAAQFNKPNNNLVDHHTYVFAGDGCLMEGISHEACSLAGTLGLGKLIVFYDDNGISIDGKVEPWFSDNTAMRFNSYHWQVIENVDGHNYQAIENAITEAQQDSEHPTLIMCKTIIGFGSNLAGSEKVHGAPLGEEDIIRMRRINHWPHEPFEIPDNLYAEWSHVEQGELADQQWLNQCLSYKQEYPELYYEFLRRTNNDLPDNWLEFSEQFILQCQDNNKNLATRKASQECIEAYASILPELLGGSADLTGSNNTNWSGTRPFSREQLDANYLNYGVREFGMSAIMNGLALHGGFIPYGGTFLVFADYARNAVRLSALMQQRVIYIYTHDSIGLGEDGPTHQPIEHAAMLRMTPDLDVWRPADLTETAVAWKHAIERHTGPSALLLSRQNLPSLPKVDISLIKKGGYIVWDCEKTPEVILLATGSEVHLALDAAKQMYTKDIAVRVVSLPCPEMFLKQTKTYKDQVLPPTIRNRIAIEAGSTAYWYQFVGLEGEVMGIDRFGASAPAEDVYQLMGLTVENTVATIEALINKC
jgi:transketolase